MISVRNMLVAALPRLRRYAFALTREPDAARELVQQTALQALTATSVPTDEERYLPWLLRIARNAFVDGHRRARRCAGGVLDTEPGSDPDSPLRALALRQALARLDPDCRAVIARVDVEGLSYQEAAVALDIPIGTVMSRLNRARRQVLAVLGDETGARP